jgi:hypothetical protein
MDSSTVRPYLIRLGIIFGLSLVFVIAFNEISFLIQKDQHDRAPKTIQLVIPAGTAESVANGEDISDIPDEIVFVLGDTLEVVNEDTASHQLGPIWVPPGSTGKLVMEKASKLAYSCSFQTSQYLGLDVRQPTTFGTRVVGISIATPTMTALIFIYSLAASPIKPKEEEIKTNNGGDHGET